MARGGTVSHLRLIAGTNKVVQRSPSGQRKEAGVHVRSVVDVDTAEMSQRAPTVRRLAPGSQGWLFPEPSLLGMVDMAGAQAGVFESLLRMIRPRWIMDLRTVPRFDYGPMNRKRFFGFCERLQIVYRDVSGLAEVSSREDASLSSGAIAGIINELLLEHPSKEAPGPILFLLENAERAELAERVLPLVVQPRPEPGWQVCIYSAR